MTFCLNNSPWILSKMSTLRLRKQILLGFSCPTLGIQTASTVLNHVNLRFFSTSTAAAISNTVSQAQIQFHQQATAIDPPNSSFSMNPKILISLLMNCKSIHHIKQVHALIITNTMLYDSLNLANKLLYVYVQHKCSTDAYILFDRMPQKNPVSWSVMIGGFAKVGDFMHCYMTFRELIRNGVQPDNYILPFMIKACRDTMRLDVGKLIHCIVLKSGLHLDHFVCAALVGMYAKCKVIDDAKLLFGTMPSKDLVTWTVMISGFAECGNAKESLVLFDHMREEGFVPDKIAMVSIVNACAKLGLINKARFVREYVRRNRFSLDVILGTAMIDMCAKCGDIDSAREIFDKMQQKNVISWSAMIAAYGYHGQGKRALELFPMMLNSGILPNKITFVSLLYACSHAGLVEDGLSLFSLMWETYGVRPDIKHHTCMVDLLGRAGQLNEALRFIENMTVQKDEGLWSAFLGACRIHKRLDLAEKAAKSLLELQPQNPGHYILLSNIYANAGQWKAVANIRDLMTKRKLKKIPGYTWIEVDNIIYQFNVGDSTHPRLIEIFGMLKILSQKLELVGYVPDTNFVLHDVDEEVKLGSLYTHSEKLAIAFALIATPEGTPIRLSKNLRICGDCHSFSKLVSYITQREIIIRDSSRFHHFKEGACSCGDYW